jgi:type I restriction enzyme R subunit
MGESWNEGALMVKLDISRKHRRGSSRVVAEKVKANVTIDWTIRESARAKLMVLVKRTLNKYGYPPDMQQKAIDTVLKQAELFCRLLV